MLKDLNKSMTRKSNRYNTVGVNQIELERKVRNQKSSEQPKLERNDIIRKDYELSKDYEDVVDHSKNITRVQGNIERKESLLENSCNVNFVGNMEL